MTRDFEIRNRRVGPSARPFVIAEMSGNHNHSLDRALEIVDAAAASGADALKIQTYTADTLTLDVEGGDFLISDPSSPWAGESLYALYESAYTPWEWHEAIFQRAEARGIVAFSTPFDDTAVDFLEDLGTPAYKIASFENTHLPLVRKVASTGKPVILSTGLATLEELEETVAAVRDSGCRDLVLLKCTSTYPATPENSNLMTITDMRNRFGCQIGLSDHTLGLGVAVAAVALGATVIEKHFTLSRSDGGVDSAFSMEPAELSALVNESGRAWQALGEVSYGPTASEVSSLRFRRSLYISEDVRAGERLTARNVRVVRPGFGLAPKHYEEVLGRSAARDLRKGTPLSWDLVD